MHEHLRIDGPDGHITCDARHWPIVIATWVGDADIESVREFFRWNGEVIERARAEGGYLMITDADRASRPAPDVRRVVAQLTNDMPEDAKSLSHGNYLVLSSALVRGAITAMQWMSREKWTTVQVGSIPEAISRAFVDLDKAGLRRPVSLDPNQYTTAGKLA